MSSITSSTLGGRWRKWPASSAPVAGLFCASPAWDSSLGSFCVLCHHEPLGFGQPIAWDAPPGFDPARHPYYAAQGNTWRIFVQQEGLAAHVLPDWQVVHIGREPGWAWLLCGGLRGPQLYPDALFPRRPFPGAGAAPAARRLCRPSLRRAGTQTATGKLRAKRLRLTLSSPSCPDPPPASTL